MAPAERADVIVDFTRVPVGTELFLINEGPDEPFGGGVPGTVRGSRNDRPGDASSWWSALASRDTSHDPARLTLPAFKAAGPAQPHAAGVTQRGSQHIPRLRRPRCSSAWHTRRRPAIQSRKAGTDPITENPALNSIEIWEMYNFTEDAHPIHIHEVQFQLVDRQPFGGGPPDRRKAGRPASRTPSSPTRARLRASRRCLTSRGCMSGTATSLNTRTTR